MDSVLEKSEYTNKHATFSNGESTSPILASKMAKKRRKKCLNKYESPEHGGFLKKKLKIFEEEKVNFLSATGCSKYTTKCVRRNLNTFFSDLKEQNFLMKVKTESSREHPSQHKNSYNQLCETFNSVQGINSYHDYQNNEERCEKIQKLRNFENKICKSDLSCEPTLSLYNKKKDNAFMGVTENDLNQASWRSDEHSPLMEFESPVRCSVKSNSDSNRSPLLFHEFDSHVGNNKNNSAEECAVTSKECIWNDDTTTTPTVKIEEYNTQKLTEENKLYRKLSPVFIDFETSPVRKSDSFKISPLKSKDLMSKDFISSRTTNVPERFCADKINVINETCITCFETVSHSCKSHESIIIEEYNSPPVNKNLSKLCLLDFNLQNDIKNDQSLLHINTAKSYEHIEDCSQESYIGGSCTSPKCRDKNYHKKVCDTIEFEQTQDENRISLCDEENINVNLLPGLSKNKQAYSLAKDAGNLQSITFSEPLGQSAALLDSPPSRRRHKAKPGSLILRLNQLVRRYRSETNVWKHEIKYMGISKKSKVNLNVLRIVSIWKESTRIILHCCRDVIVDCKERESCNPEGNIDFKIVVVLETLDAQDLVEGSCVRIFPPWQILELENKRTLVFLCVSKLEILSDSKLLSNQIYLKKVAEKNIVRDFSSHISQSCFSQKNCSIFSEIKALYFPIIFKQNLISKTTVVKRYYPSQLHTVKSAVINSAIFSEIHVRGHVLYEFRCRNGRNGIVGPGTTANIMVVDNENEVFQIVLKTESDEHKWELEKTKHSNMQNICFQFSGLVACTRLEVHRMPGLATLLSYLKQTSNRQDYLYVLSASCDWWNLKPSGKSDDYTLLPDKIDNNSLLWLCYQTEEIRQTAVVTVLHFTGKKLYFQGNRLKPYGIICIDDFVVVPKIKCGYTIEICCLKCVSEKFIIDRYSVVTVQENWAKHISFYVALLPCLTMQTQTEDLVTIKGIIKEINKEYCSCDKNWKDSLSGRCQALCKTSSEKNKTITAFIKVSELPNECTVEVKGLNKTLCSGSAVSLVCLVINVLRNKLGKVCGFIVQNL